MKLTNLMFETMAIPSTYTFKNGVSENSVDEERTLQ